MQILVIEDEALIQRSLKKMLEALGHKVDACSSGREALTLIASKVYDRIVCDLMLQDTTGFDVIEDSKRVMDRKAIASKFVLMTAYSSPQVINRAKSYGCDFLKKPFDSAAHALETITKIDTEKETTHEQIGH